MIDITNRTSKIDDVFKPIVNDIVCNSVRFNSKSKKKQ